ncbi:helix-turn-helix domain-containing protein [Rubritalea tangerina]|uniref:Helix-turn-helix domain-containing protein n=1 Tax=Rubritalea tangerina TaxID=430798 RepID=A0ABW4ZAT8_9BACT
MPDNTSNILGETIHALMRQRGLKAFELGEKIALSPTSISKIVNGVTRPRQNTFTRMCQVLCETKEEERRLVAAFAGTKLLDEELDEASAASNKEILRLRAEQFIERKTQAIAFKRSVARELDKIGVDYEADHYEGIYSTDFLIQKEGKRLALECKANVGRDIDRSIATCEVIQENLRCEVIVVVPFVDAVCGEAQKKGMKVSALNELAELITN